MKTELIEPRVFSRKGPDQIPNRKPAPAPQVARLTRLLVPLDFSPASQKALDYALALAGRCGSASLHLMHVVEPRPECFGGEMGPVWLPDEDLAASCEHQLAALAQQSALPGVPISSAVHLGRPAAGIIAVAKESQADLVVIATHGRTGLKHLLLGSVAERVVREAPCPVLVVREREHEFIGLSGYGPAPVRLHQILVPTDFSPASAETLRYAVEFARQLGARITLCHSVHLSGVFPTPEIPDSPSQVLLDSLRDSARDRLKDLQRLSIPAELAGSAEVRIGPPAAEIPELARSGGYDLILCATRGFTGLKHLFLGGTAEAIVRHAPCPVLVVRRAAADQAGTRVAGAAIPAWPSTSEEEPSCQ